MNFWLFIPRINTNPAIYVCFRNDGQINELKNNRNTVLQLPNHIHSSEKMNM